MNSKSTLVFLVAFIIGFGAGFFVEKTMLESQNNQEVAKLQSQIERAKKFFPPLSQDIRGILGTVKEVHGDTITVEITVMNPFDESPQTRLVTIANETKIVRSNRKDPAAYQREIAEFQKNIQAQSGKSLITPQNEFTQEPAKISDIAIGQQISIAASENIRDKESFTAKTIIISGATSTNTP